MYEPKGTGTCYEVLLVEDLQVSVEGTKKNINVSRGNKTQLTNQLGKDTCKPRSESDNVYVNVTYDNIYTEKVSNSYIENVSKHLHSNDQSLVYVYIKTRYNDLGGRIPNVRKRKTSTPKRVPSETQSHWASRRQVIGPGDFRSCVLRKETL